MEQGAKHVYAGFMLKHILIGLSVCILLLLGAILILPGLVPTDSYRDRLEADLSRSLSRDVAISGDIKISTFPVIQIETGSVSLANPEDFLEGQFVEVKSLSAKVKLWPLLRKRVEISGITLQSPTIRLQTLEDGRRNWAGKETDKTVETGPFKRDGRFTEYDPALALLRIQNGSIQYSDAATDQDIRLENINIDLSIPSLNKPLSLNGDFLLDGLETAIDTNIASPADFLNGLATDFSANIITPDGDIKTSGQFLPGEDIAITATFNAESQSPNRLAARLPFPEDITLPDLTSLTANGEATYSPTVMRMSDLKFGATGTGIEIAYSGALDLSEGATNKGQFSANLEDMSIIEPYLEEPIDALNALSSISSKGDIEWSSGQFSASNLEAIAKGSDLSLEFIGSAAFTDALRLNGDFEGETDDISKLVKMAGLDQPDAAALKRLYAKGRIALADGKTTLTNLTATASEGHLNGDYSGEISFQTTLDLDGAFSGEISDLKALDEALPRDIPYSDIAKRITIASQIQSDSGTYTFSNLSAELLEGLLNGDFRGTLKFGTESDISGALSINAESLRAIAATRNVTLPASTEGGEIFETLGISGNVSGTPEEITFESGRLTLDSLAGTGDFTVDLRSAKPMLRGALAFGPLDLRPYMAAWSEQNPNGEILPWSEEKITLAGLEAANANIDISAPSILMDRIELGQTSGVVTLVNGILTADLKNMALYGGTASGTFSMQSINGVPTIDINTTIKSVAAQEFFLASGGFNKVTGTSDISMDFKGRGESQAAIMRSLTGDGTFTVKEGQLLGLDAGTLLSGIDTALSERKLPQGIGLGETTQFNDIDGLFVLSNGRALLNGFNLQSGDFFMEADGAIDIGQQSIDVGIRPKLTTGSDLAQFGIPLRFTGGFGQTNASLDSNFLQDIAIAKARGKAGDTIKDNIGRPLGGILGGVIGGNTQTSPSAPAEGDTPPSETEAQPEPLPTKPEPETPEQANTPEAQIENALKGLFGRKKTDDKAE